MLDPDFRYTIGVRHVDYSLITKIVCKLISDNDILCLACSQLDTIHTPAAELTSDSMYLRFIGDRSIDKKDFGKIEKDRIRELRG